MVQKSDNSWGKSGTYHVMTFYLQPLLLWTGAMLVCRLVHSIASSDPSLMTDILLDGNLTHEIYFLQSIRPDGATNRS